MTQLPKEYRENPPFLELTNLLLPSVSIADLLDLVINLAVQALSGVDGASVSVVNRDGQHFETSNASSADVRVIDEAQYDRAEGPCVQAIRTESEVSVDLPTGRWPEFDASASGDHIQSVSSFPLRAAERTLGALNLYSVSRRGMDSDAARLARVLASQAGVVLANLAALKVAEMTSRQLQEALQTRDIIGQAKGIIMARERVDAEKAFDILRRGSQRTNRKLRDLAADIVGTFGDRGVAG